MLDELITITESYEFEEYGSIYLTRVHLEGDELNLTLHLYMGGEPAESQYWRIVCSSYREHHLSLGPCTYIRLHYNHVLLCPYIYPRASVSFYGEAKNPLAVIGALYQRHYELTNGELPFSTFLNGDILKLVKGRYGMLADGPLPLMKEYAEVMKWFGISAKVSEPTPALITNDETGGLREIAVLILDRGSYVVSGKLHAYRLREAEI